MSISSLIGILLEMSQSVSSSQEQFTETLSKSKYLEIIVLVGTLTVSRLTKLTEFLDNLFQFFTKYRPQEKRISSERLARLRYELIAEQLKQVTTRLNTSLHNKSRVNLQYEKVRRSELEAERDDNKAILVDDSLNPFTSKVSDPCSSAFELMKSKDIQGRLLILGEPSSGKTNELLVTVKQYLIQAQSSIDKSIPVIFELSEWQLEEDAELETWMKTQLQDKYNIPAMVAKQWMESEQLMPCFDGLDELRRVNTIGQNRNEIDQIREKKQIKCLRAINLYLDLHSQSSCIVCCRYEEYKILEGRGEKLRSLKGAILLKEVSHEQINNYLKKELNKQNIEPVWNFFKAIEADIESQTSNLKGNQKFHWTQLPDCPQNGKQSNPVSTKYSKEDIDSRRAFIQKPLFLVMLLVACQRQQPDHSQSIKYNLPLIDQLIDTYIRKQVDDRCIASAYKPRDRPALERMNSYLRWLANQFKNKEFTEFLIERLEPNWLDSKFEKKYPFVKGLIFGIVFFIIYGLSSIIADGLQKGLLEGLYAGLLSGLVVGLSNYHASKKGRFSWKCFFKPWVFGVLYGLLYGLQKGCETEWNYGFIYGLCVGLIVCLIVGICEGMKIKEGGGKRLILSLIFGAMISWCFELSFGLKDWPMIGLWWGLTSWVILFLREGLEKPGEDIKLNEVSNISWDWQRFIKSGLFSGLVLGVPFGIFKQQDVGWIIGIFGGLGGGLGQGFVSPKLDVNDKVIPNQGVINSLKRGLFLGLLTGLVLGLAFGLIAELSDKPFPLREGLKQGLRFGLSGGLFGGLKAVLQHLSLRIVLCKSRDAPWNYSRFLKHAENHSFIIRVGGRYRFVHDLVRQRFACDLWAKPLLEKNVPFKTRALVRKQDLAINASDTI